LENITYQSVSKVVSAFNQALESAFPQIYVEGEISQLTKAASGHLYFTLKDEKSQVAAVMWRGMAENVPFKVEAGLHVLCHGKPNVYTGSGRLQLIVHKLLPSGEGLLQKKFLELKAKLEKEGLFAPERKRALPFLPKAVGVVTSGTGAVIHDIMVKINERMPIMQVYLANARVQGEGAAEEIAEGVRRLSESGIVDLIIVARGGGSLEDLWAFNEEVVVRAIFASRVPVVSGVGHEVDVTLSDFVADVRAPTPTAAAEMVVPRREDLLATLSEHERRLMDYERWFMPLAQRVDELALKLEGRVAASFSEAKLKLGSAEARLLGIRPDKVLAIFQSKVELLRERLYSVAQRGVIKENNRLDTIMVSLGRGLDSNLIRARHILEKLISRIDGVDPRKVLSRGYSVVEIQGRVVKSSADLKINDQIGITFAAGKAEAVVSGKR